MFLKALSLKLYQKTRLLQGTHLFGSLLALLYFRDLTWLLYGVLAYFFYETFGGNIGLHRYFGHRSFKTSTFWDFFLCVMANLVGAGSTISWVGVHRIHHDASDQPNDVHSPYHQSWSQIFFGNWNVQVPPSKVKDLVHLRLHRFFHKYYFWFHITVMAILLSISVKAFVYLYCLPCTLCLLSGYLLAILGHIHGYRTYQTADFSRNSWLVNLYTFGEGWHNNHHHNPGRARQGEKWWEFDVPAFFISTLLARK